MMVQTKLKSSVLTANDVLATSCGNLGKWRPYGYGILGYNHIQKIKVNRYNISKCTGSKPTEPLHLQYEQFMKSYNQGSNENEVENLNDNKPLNNQGSNENEVENLNDNKPLNKIDVVIQEVYVYFENQSLVKRYLIIFVGGIIVGVLMLKVLPLFLNGLVQLAESMKANQTVPSPDSTFTEPINPYPYDEPGVKKPDEEISWRQFIAVLILRAIYVYFGGT